jgi:hypothetical protein
MIRQGKGGFMTTVSLNAVGFCAHYSRQGDWAFNYALQLSSQKSLHLNVFHFLADPYDPNDTTGKGLAYQERERLAIEKERELRLYYDELAGDYLEVGFRLCEDNEWTELHRCLLKKEFQVLVLGFVRTDAMFGGKPILEFANAFVSPVVLVGPNSPNEFYLNAAAALVSEKLGFGKGFVDVGSPGLHIRHFLAVEAAEGVPAN